MPNINWDALNSLSRAKTGQSHPIRDSALSSPAVQAQLRNLAQTQQAPGAMYVAKNALNGGELSPMLGARFDQPRYLTGCKLLRNMIPLPQGGITKRPGLYNAGLSYGGENPRGCRARFIPFQFAQGESLMLEFTSLNNVCILNVWSPDGRMICANAVKPEMPYGMDELARISFAQSADVVYLAHGAHPPAKLMRHANDDWRYEVIDWMPSIAAPGAPTISWEGNPGEWNWQMQLSTYKYVVTAVDKETGDESPPSPEVKIENAVPIGTNGYYLVLTVPPVENAAEYRVYKREGGVYGFIGRITDVEKSPLTFDDRNITPDTADTPPAARDPFAVDGYPTLVFFHQQRLCWAASWRKPLTIWMSESGNYESMAAATPPLDDHAIEVTLSSSEVNGIVWCVSDRNILSIGTKGGEWILTGANGDVLTPSNLSFQPQTSHGSQYGLSAIRTGRGLIFVQYGGRVVRQFVYSFNTDRYEAPELGILARHILDGAESDIVGWAYQAEPYGIVWCVLANGTLAGMTYLPEQEVIAWHRHDTNGFIEDIACITFPDGFDRLWMHVVRDGKRYVEILKAFYLESDSTGNEEVMCDGVNGDEYVCECVPHLPETTLQNGATYMRVRKLNALKAQVWNCRPFRARIGDGPWMNVPERLPDPDYATGQALWNVPIAGGWRENADLVLRFPGKGKATVLGILATVELADMAGGQK